MLRIFRLLLYNKYCKNFNVFHVYFIKNAFFSVLKINCSFT